MAIYNIASTVLVAGINFITIPIFTRMLNTSGYGIVNIYVAWVQICTVVIGLKADGSIGSASANLPEGEQDSYQLSVLVMSLIPFMAILMIAMLFSEPLSMLLDMKSNLILCTVLQGFGAFIISFFSMRFIFRKQASYNFLISVGLCVSTTVLSILLILFMFRGDSGYLGRIYGLTVPNLLIAAGLFFHLAVKHKSTVKIKYWRFCLALSLPLVFHGLSQILLAQTGKIAIQRYYSDSLAGVYSIAVVIVSLLNAIYNALNNAFVPFMYDDLAGKTSDEKKISHFKNYFTSFTLGTCAFALIAPEMLKIMSTDAYWDATTVLPPLVVGQYCVFLYSFPVNYEFYKMSTKSVAVGTLLAAIANVTFCIILVPSFGIMGAAVATMLAYLGLFAFHFFIARYVLGDDNYPAKYYLYGLAMVVISCITCYPLETLYIIRWGAAILLLLLVAMRIYRTKSVF